MNSLSYHQVIILPEGQASQYSIANMPLYVSLN